MTQPSANGSGTPNLVVELPLRNPSTLASRRPSFRHPPAEAPHNQAAKVYETVSEPFDVAPHAHVVQPEAGIASDRPRERFIFIVLFPTSRLIPWHRYRSFRSAIVGPWWAKYVLPLEFYRSVGATPYVRECEALSA